MKKLLVLVALLFLPLFASAQQGDTLLTPDGTLYAVQFERAEDHPEVAADATAYLVLTTRTDGEVKREIVPPTLGRGANSSPVLAFDSASGMLFLFWIHNESMLTSQLMFSTRSADGTWTEATSFGAWGDHRKNLRLAVTRRYEDEEGVLRAGLTVHLAWWELNTTTGKDSAQYAMVSVGDGGVIDMLPVDLTPYVTVLTEGETAPDIELSRNVLNQPLLFSSSSSVLVMFGDNATGTMNQVRFTPKKIAANGRLRVPGGKREGGFVAPAMNLTANSRLEGVYGDNNDRIAFYATVDGALRYSVLKDGAWSQHAIALDEQLSTATAVDALRRLVNEH